MPSPGPVETLAASAVRPPIWRRRRYVIDPRYQIRAGVLIGSTALVLLILLNTSLIVHGPAAPASATAAHPAVHGQNPATFALLLLGSAVFIAGVVLVGLLESHRTAGAAFAIRRAVDALREGQSQVRVRLRRDDHLQELARSINELAETIDRERMERR